MIIVRIAITSEHADGLERLMAVQGGFGRLGASDEALGVFKLRTSAGNELLKSSAGSKKKSKVQGDEKF